MPAKEPLAQLMGVSASHLTRDEKIYLEADLFFRICEELKTFFISQYKHYTKLLKSTNPLENKMLDADFTRSIIKDILLSEEYTLDGIAQYANTHTDVLYDIALGHNVAPSATFLQRVIALHRTVKPELYRSILNKIIEEHRGSDETSKNEIMRDD